MTKICSVCGVTKELTEFYKYSRSADKLTYDCKQCIRDRQKKYYVRPERRVIEKAYKKEYGQRPDVIAKKRAYSATEHALELRRQWHADPTSRAIEMAGAARARSRKRGCEFDLVPTDIAKVLIGGKCEVTGIPFNFVRGRGGKMHPWSPSLDRMDCSKGYVKGNVQVVVWALNAARNHWGNDVLNTLVVALAARRNGHPGNEDNR